MLYNQRQLSFGATSLDNSSNLIWLPLGLDVRQKSEYRITTTTFDAPASLNPLNSRDEILFKLEKSQDRLLFDSKGKFLLLCIEMNLDQDALFIDTEYPLLDALGNTGGLLFMLIFILGSFVTVCTFQRERIYLTSRLYKIVEKEHVQSDSDSEASGFPKRPFVIHKIKPTCTNCMSYMEGILPGVCFKPCDCRDSRSKLRKELALKKLDKETNVVDQIKTQRFLISAVKLLLSKEKRKELKQKSSYSVIDPENNVFLQRDKDTDVKDAQIPKKRPVSIKAKALTAVE